MAVWEVGPGFSAGGSPVLGPQLALGSPAVRTCEAGSTELTESEEAWLHVSLLTWRATLVTPVLWSWPRALAWDG